MNDLELHSETPDCHCNPAVQVEEGEIFIVHNSFDGREFREQLVAKVKEQFNYDNKIDLTYL
jgi:hypothetical protein